MEETVKEVVTRFGRELGSGWNITSKHLFDVVYYFDCEFEGTHFLTCSYGIYKETDVDKIIKREIDHIKRFL